MTNTATILLSLMMLAAFALALGGVYVLASKRGPTRGLLMLVAAIVLIANVLTWTL